MSIIRLGSQFEPSSLEEGGDLRETGTAVLLVHRLELTFLDLVHEVKQVLRHSLEVAVSVARMFG